jgi:hypothetical protein
LNRHPILPGDDIMHFPQFYDKQDVQEENCEC